MPEASLPEAFRDLEQWTAWSLETEKERSDKRQASTIEELKAFYDAMFARTDEALSNVDQFQFDNLPPDAHRLFQHTHSLAEEAPAVDQFGQPQVDEGYDSERDDAARRE
jgi:hypothetical protein